MILPGTSIIIYGHDSRLLETRRLVLEQAGAHAYTAADLAALAQLEPKEPVELVILCYSLSIEDRRRAHAFAKTRWPQAQRLSLISGESGWYPGIADELVDASRGPAYLLQTIEGLLKAKSASQSHIALPSAAEKLPSLRKLG